MMGLILRSFVSKSRAFLLKAYKSRVRSILEYNCEIWSPCALGDIDLLESVQRNFTRRIFGLSELSYIERLRICNLEPLELRRVKRDLVLVYKIIHKLIGLEFDLFFTYAPTIHATRTNGFKLYPKQVKSTRALNFFDNRVINHWNNLPESVVSANCLSSFCRLLDNQSVLLNSFLRGRAIRNQVA